MTRNDNDQAATVPVDPGLIGMARVIAEKYEHSAQENLREAGWWDREAERYTHLPVYSTWAKDYAGRFRRDAREDQDVAGRNRRYIARALAAVTRTTSG